MRMSSALSILCILCICCCLLGLSACEKESFQSDATDASLELRANGLSSASCFNFKYSTRGKIGFVCLPEEFDLCGFGAFPTEATVGPVSGWMSSVVTGQRLSGKGATHLSLMHYFSDNQGNSFWTEDRAICAPAGKDPLTCGVHDVLQVVGGTGMFRNASGSLRNHGTLDFRVDSLTINLSGRICGTGF